MSDQKPIEDVANPTPFELALSLGDPQALAVRKKFDEAFAEADRLETLQRLDGLTRELPVAAIRAEPEHAAVEAVRKVVEERNVAVAAWRAECEAHAADLLALREALIALRVEVEALRKTLLVEQHGRNAS